ncbi:MAG: hypothetical protein E7380_05035 [Clostridiales bacterium]|nr:hypothetical protein [Clostridiales bacterium]
MRNKNVEEFRLACKEYFSSLSVSALRAYGVFLCLRKPSTLNKTELIAELIAVLCGEITPQRVLRGAPLKNKYLDPSIVESVESLKKHFLEEEEPVLQQQGEEPVLPPQPQPIPPAIVKIELNMESLSQEQKELLGALLKAL